MQKQHTPLHRALLLLTLLTAFSISANAQPKTGGKNNGRSNTSGCCRPAFRPVLPAGAQERRALQAPQPLFGGNKRGGEVEITVLNAAGQVQPPAKWSIRNEEEVMLIDLSSLPAGKYTIQLQAGTSYDEYEVGSDDAKPRLLGAWEQVEIVEGIINLCLPSSMPADHCGACLSSDTDCITFLSGWKRVTGGAQARMATLAPVRADGDKLAAFLKTASKGESTFLVCQCASGELRKITKMSDCAEGCVVMVFERKKR